MAANNADTAAVRVAAATWTNFEFVRALRRAIGARRDAEVRLLCAIAVERGDVVLGDRRDRDNTWSRNDLIPVACRFSNVSALQCLCDLPAKLGVRDQVRWSEAVYVAAAAGNLDAVRHLCELPAQRGVTPGARKSGYRGGHAYNALCVASRGGHTAVVRYLCELPAERGVKPDADDNAALRDAAATGQIAVVRYLCELPPERRVNPSADDNAALREAASAGHIAVVRYLCELPPERGVDSSARGNVALRHAATRGHVSVVLYLSELLLSRAATHGVVDNVMATQRSFNMRPHLVAGRARAIRFLVLAVPGADSWLDTESAAACAARQRHFTARGLGDPAMTWLVEAVRLRPLWRRRRCLLLLRRLAAGGRAIPVAVPPRVVSRWVVSMRARISGPEQGRKVRRTDE